MAVTKQILPGVYSQIIAGEREAGLSARGTVAMALDLDWGAEFTTILRGNDTIVPLGYDFTDPKIKLVREVLQNAGTLLLYRLNASSGSPAQATLASGITAKAIYNGTRGNDIKVTVTPSDDLFVIRTFLGTREMDAQAVSKPEDFIPNSFIKIEGTGTLEAKTVTLSSGTSGEATQAAGHEAAFAEFQKHSFNTLCYTGTDTETKGKYAAFVEKLETAGVDIQVVMNVAEQKGVHILNNTIGGGPSQYELTAAEACATMAGIQASCGIERSATRFTVDHWTHVNPKLDRWQMQDRTAKGEILFAEKNGRVYVVYDTDHPADWAKNLVTRTLFAITADLEKMLDEKVVGKVRNSKDGRNQVKGMCVQLISENYLNNGYIEDFEASDVTVECMGDDARDSIKVTAGVRVVDTADKIYLVVISR